MEKSMAPPWSENHFLGNLVGASGSRGLKEAFFNQSMKMYSPKDPDSFGSTSTFISGAANALAGDPQLLEQKLKEMNDNGTLDGFLKNLDPKSFNQAMIPEEDSAYPKLPSAAAYIQPPTAEVSKLFRYTADHYMGGDYNDVYKMTDAMTALYSGGYNTYARASNGKILDSTFHSNAEFLLMDLSRYGQQKEGPAADPEALKSLSNFLGNTAFNDKFANHDQVMRTTQTAISNLRTALDNWPNVDDRTKKMIDESNTASPNDEANPTLLAQQSFARQLGRMTRGVFQGYENAVQDENANNAERDSMVDFLFNVVPVDKAANVAKAVPGVGTAAGLTADQAVDLAKQKLKDSWHDKDVSDNREEVFKTVETQIENTFPSDLWGPYTDGYDHAFVTNIDTTNKPG
jgi:hypothetical protein